jgi:hypothetical protein
LKDDATGKQEGFFAWADGGDAAPVDTSGSVDVDYEPYRGQRATADQLLQVRPSAGAPTGVLTGPLGARVLAPLLARLDRPDVRIVEVANDFFGGNTGVTGLMVGADLAAALADQPVGHRYLLPDVCLSNGRFLDGLSPADLPRPVEVIAPDGHALRAALETSARSLVVAR